MKSIRLKSTLPILLGALAFAGAARAQVPLPESLPPLPDGKSPQTIQAVWAGYNPEAEPLDVEVAEEWEQDGVVMRLLRYRIGVFKGHKAMMAAFYGFPKRGKHLPGLVEVSGGGQAANPACCLTAAQHGYACISLNWRAEHFPSYVGSAYQTGGWPAIALAVESAIDHGFQTDWGAVCGKQIDAAGGINPGPLKYDNVPSGRNEGYFWRVLAARRALTFLEKQPEVDGNQLGIYGHSMGGVITIETAAIDPRVKAAAPSCAPPLTLKPDSLEGRTADALAYVPLLTCPTLFMDPANDFHGKIENIERIVATMPGKDWRLDRSPFLNHRATDEDLADLPLWFDAHLKGNFTFPATPAIAMQLHGTDGRPLVAVTPDTQRAITAVDVYFSREPENNDVLGMKKRDWHYAQAHRDGKVWRAALDLDGIDRPLLVYADVHYKLDHPIGWHSNYFGPGDPSPTMHVASRLLVYTSAPLADAKVVAKATAGPVIETFRGDWHKRWYTFGNDQWPIRTCFLNDTHLRPVPLSKLVLQLISAQPNKLVIGLNGYSAEVALKGGGQPETVVLYPYDLHDQKSGHALFHWADAIGDDNELSIGPGDKWAGPLPTFRQLRWEPITAADYDAHRPFQLGKAPAVDGKTALTLDLADRVACLLVNTDLPSDNKRAFRRVINVNAPAEISYFLNGQFATLHTNIVPGPRCSITCTILGDGKPLFESGPLNGNSKPQELTLPIAGVKQLQLIVGDGGNGPGGDWLTWGDPYLTR